MRTQFPNSVLVTGAAALLSFAGTGLAQADIIVGNTDSSGEISGNGSAADSSSFTFINDGEFMAVAIAMGTGANGVGFDLSSPTVTYGGSTAVQGIMQQRSNDHWMGIFYFTDPALGANTLSVDFGGNVLNPGAWEFGAISMSNVNESDPIAGSAGDGEVENSDLSIPAQTAGEINAGDLVLLATNGRGDYAAGPHYSTPTGDETSLFLNGLPQDGSAQDDGSGSTYNALYQVLASGDISSDAVLMTQNANYGANVSATGGVVFNVIPEPASLALLSLGGLLLLPRRRR